MERESFIFYKSFYEAIRELPKDIRLEVLTAIIEYALFGKSPENLKPFANGMFILIKPNIDVNTSRFENGKKGGRRRNSTIAADTTPEQPTLPHNTTEQPKYSASFHQEVERMSKDSIWIEQGVCMKLHIDKAVIGTLLKQFLAHCISYCSEKPHKSYGDAQQHFIRWYRTEGSPTAKKQTKSTESQPSARETKVSQSPSDYTFSGGFGGEDV